MLLSETSNIEIQDTLANVAQTVDLAEGDQRQLNIRDFENASRVVSAQRLRLEHQVTKVRATLTPDILDPEMAIHGRLEKMKESLRIVRRRILDLQQEERQLPNSLKLQQAIADLRNITEETYTTANKLQWEIAEHDATSYSRGAPWLVTNQDQLDNALNKIQGLYESFDQQRLAQSQLYV